MTTETDAEPAFSMRRRSVLIGPARLEWVDTSCRRLSGLNTYAAAPLGVGVAVIPIDVNAIYRTPTLDQAKPAGTGRCGRPGRIGGAYTAKLLGPQAALIAIDVHALIRQALYGNAEGRRAGEPTERCYQHTAQ